MKKYKLTEESMEYKGHTLWRIQNTITGEMGGWIESYANMTQEEGCMIWDEAKVYGHAYIDNEATISGEAEVFGNAKVIHNARVYGKATVSGDALIGNRAVVYGEASISEFASIKDYAIIAGKAKVYGHALVYEFGNLFDHAQLYEDAQVYGWSSVTGQARVYGNARLHGTSMVSGDVEVYEDALIFERAYVYRDARIYGNARVYGMAQVKGNARVHGNAVVKGNEIIGGNANIDSYEYKWEDIGRLVSLTIQQRSDPGTPEVNLYANGRQEIAVMVQLEALDSGGYPMQLADRIVYQNIQFVNEQNLGFGNQFRYSEHPGDYVIGSFLKDGTRFEGENRSQSTFYLSTDTVLNEVKLCVSCLVITTVNGSEVEREYSTALTNNPSIIPPAYVLMQVIPERRFTQDDIVINTLVVKNPNDYNSLLMKYYIQFSNASAALLKKVETKTDFWFHYKQKGNYKGFATSTDDRFQQNAYAEFTAVFEISNSWTIRVTSTNHDLPGLCLWTYRVWHGALWTYDVWNEQQIFYLFDQDGNAAKVNVKALDDVVLEFTVS